MDPKTNWRSFVKVSAETSDAYPQSLGKRGLTDGAYPDMEMKARGFAAEMVVDKGALKGFKLKARTVSVRSTPSASLLDNRPHQVGHVDVDVQKCTIDPMRLERCKDQPSETLDEFYERVAGHDSHVDREAGSAMLDLISRLRRLSDERRVWGLTSLYRLCLLAQDTYQSPWYVIVSALDRNNYYIEYLMPSALAPWPAA